MAFFARTGNVPQFGFVLPRVSSYLKRNLKSFAGDIIAGKVLSSSFCLLVSFFIFLCDLTVKEAKDEAKGSLIDGLFN